MKKLLYTLTAILVSNLVMAQTQTENYVKSTTYQAETTDGEHKTGTSTDLSDDDKIETVTYFDGLGRPKQSVSKQTGGNRQDIITPIVYDALGRQSMEYLPYADPNQTSGASLDYRNPLTLLNNLEDYYVNKYPGDGIASSTINAYSEKHFEDSPLNRVLEQGAPGKDWLVDHDNDTDHTIKFEYATNVQGEVDLFKVIFPTLNTEEPQLYYDGKYEAGELYKTITKDENWQPNQTTTNAHTTEEFKNKQGQVILKRTYDSNGVAHDTQYVYDDYGNLTYVLSPKGSDLVFLGIRYQSSTTSVHNEFFIPRNKYGRYTTYGTGSANVIMDAPAGTIEVSFNITFNDPTQLRNGAIFQLASGMPDMIIGTILNGSYTISVQDGYLYVAGSGTVSSINETIVADLPQLSINQVTLDDLCYQYHYDKRNRLVEKKIPQKGWEYIVYDKLDRPILTQDANLRATDDWIFTKYDAFDRPVYTGTFHRVPKTPISTGPENQERISIQQTVDQGTVYHETLLTSPIALDGTNIYYSNNAYPKTNLTLFTVNYYDSYNPVLSAAFPNPTTVFGQSVTNKTKNLSTGSMVKVLGTNDWIMSVSYYDNKARPIYAGSKNNYLNTTDIVKSELDFAGKVLKTESTHTKGSNNPIVVTDYFTYDHASRLLTQNQQIGSGDLELIVKNTYDELGQLKKKGVGGQEASPLQNVDYTYNIRGWLKAINDKENLGNDLFAFGINYNTTELGQTNAPLFNGNISETIWRTTNDVATSTTRGYAYQYDALNRIELANMSIDTGNGFGLANGYHVNGLNYDKNGNIVSLQRTGATAVFDDLTYNYKGNQLLRVSDAITNQQTEGFIDGNTSGNDYQYDDNGNMVEDKNKSIANISYNHLNLPRTVSFGGSDEIEYIYDATGAKLEKMVTDNSTVTKTYYAGNYIYEEGSSGEELKFFSHPEGYVEPDGQGSYNYIYQYKDHLGNIRLSFSNPNDNYESLIDSGFYEDYDGWEYTSGPANGSIEIDDGQLKVNAKNAYNGVRFYLDEDTNIGDEIEIVLDFNIGTTDQVRIILKELDLNNNLLNYYTLSNDLQTGSHVFNHTVQSGSKLELKIDKHPNSSDVGILKYFYLDNVFSKSGELEIIEENNYYPFGLKHKGYNYVVTSTNIALNWKFGGKEYNQELGLDWYDISARNYDPAIGRWMNLDPLAEQMRRHSPYNYAFDNPVYFIDPDGMKPFGSGDKPWWKDRQFFGEAVQKLENKLNEVLDEVEEYVSTFNSPTGERGKKTDTDGFAVTSSDRKGDQSQLDRGPADITEVPKETLDAGKGYASLKTNQNQKNGGDGKTNATLKGDGSKVKKTLETSKKYSSNIKRIDKYAKAAGEASINIGNTDEYVTEVHASGPSVYGQNTDYVSWGTITFDTYGEAQSDSTKVMDSRTSKGANSYGVDSVTIRKRRKKGF